MVHMDGFLGGNERCFEKNIKSVLFTEITKERLIVTAVSMIKKWWFISFVNNIMPVTRDVKKQIEKWEEQLIIVSLNNDEIITLSTILL